MQSSMLRTKDDVGNRKSPRRAFQRSVGVLIRGKYFVVDALEIGEGGISLQGPVDLALGDQLVVTVVLPGLLGHAIARAEVRNLRGLAAGAKAKPSVGLQFLNMPLMSRRAIRNYVAAKTEDEALSADG